MIILPLIVATLYASTGTLTASITPKTTAQIYVDNIKGLSTTEKISSLYNELQKYPDVATGQVLQNHMIYLMKEKESIDSGSNRIPTIYFPVYEQKK